MAVGLLERAGVLALFDGLVDGASASAGGAVLIEASARMGKTVLLNEVRSRVGQSVFWQPAASIWSGTGCDASAVGAGAASGCHGGP